MTVPNLEHLSGAAILIEGIVKLTTQQNDDKKNTNKEEPTTCSASSKTLWDATASQTKVNAKAQVAKHLKHLYL